MKDYIQETEEEIIKDINYIRPMQTSDKIREHINELYRGLEYSRYPKVVKHIIDFWELKYKIKKEYEQLKQQNENI